MLFMTSSDGVRLAYEVEGAGPPLVLHLGAGCDSSLWRAAGYLEPLTESYTCILFDHRGHGESDKPRGAAAYELDRLTEDVLELLDHLEIRSAAFWGYSSGISPGVRLAERHPERVWALIASGAVGPPADEPPAEVAARARRAAADYRENGWEKLVARFEAEEPETIPRWMTDRIRATDVEQYADLIECWAELDWEEWDVLPEMQTPMLFLTGALEDPDDDVGNIVARMPRAEVLRLSGMGHINAFLATSAVLPRVTAFLAEHAADLSMQTGSPA